MATQEHSLTIYLSDTERKKYSREASKYDVSRSEYIRWCVFYAQFIPKNAATKNVRANAERKAIVLYVSDAVHQACLRGAQEREIFTKTKYVKWCLLNAELIPEKYWAYNAPMENSPEKPKRAPPKKKGHTKEHPALVQLVSEMTLDDFAEHTNCSVREIVEWAMGAPPPPADKQEAEQADADVLETHLQVVNG